MDETGEGSKRLGNAEETAMKNINIGSVVMLVPEKYKLGWKVAI